MWTESVVSNSSLVKRPVGFLLLPLSSHPKIAAPYILLKSESHKKEKSGAEAEAGKIEAVRFGAV